MTIEKASSLAVKAQAAEKLEEKTEKPIRSIGIHLDINEGGVK